MTNGYTLYILAVRLYPFVYTWRGYNEVGISIDNGKIIIKKISKPKYPNLLERLEAYYGKMIDEIYVEDSQEIRAISLI